MYIYINLNGQQVCHLVVVMAIVFFPVMSPPSQGRYGMFIGFPCSKKRKQLEQIMEHWRQKAQTYEQRSDEGAKTDSQDKCDHSVWPTDENVAAYCKKWT